MHTQPRPEPPVPIAPIHRRSWRTLWRRCSCGLSEPCVDRLTTAQPIPGPRSDADPAADRTPSIVSATADSPMPDTLSNAGAADSRASDRLFSAGPADGFSPDSPLTDPHGGAPPQRNEPRGRLYRTPAPRQRRPVEDLGPAGAHPEACPPWSRSAAFDGSTLAVQGPVAVQDQAAAHLPASPPVRFRTTGRQPAFPRRSDSDLFRSLGSTGLPLAPTGRSLEPTQHLEPSGRPLGPTGRPLEPTQHLEPSERPLGPIGRPIRTRDAQLGRAGLLTPGQASRSTPDMAGKSRRPVVPLPRKNGTVR